MFLYSFPLKADNTIDQRALQTRYTQMAKAWLKRDVRGFMHEYSSNFHRKLPNGSTRSFAQEAKAYQEYLHRLSPTRRLTLQIRKASFNNKEAVVVVDILWDHKDGELRWIDTDTWHKTKGGWKLNTSSNRIGDKFGPIPQYDGSHRNTKRHYPVHKKQSIAKQAISGDGGVKPRFTTRHFCSTPFLE